ncbi:hypothetical protein [Endozoicomonas sp. SCSIO W0465]|uniref:hypothetical protein n=1 Tax=Endozoicomonas sp. SCSIO W0465 TaxID=2918516 RepID=UPI00207540E6|nr:hypothetical protein [Endozoicomonas sp. SCSIO W0465]USE37810.1 hypothetical protein MJO57_06355 [Endozoicomonas sp. SCSIO W0465]
MIQRGGQVIINMLSNVKKTTIEPFIKKHQETCIEGLQKSARMLIRSDHTEQAIIVNPMSVRDEPR